MGSLSIVNGADGRIAILNGRDGETIHIFEAMEGEWWAAQMLFGAIQLRGADTGPAARTWREIAGFGEGQKPKNIEVKFAMQQTASPMILTFKNGTSLFGLHEPADEALGLQMLDAVRKARGLEPLAIEKWKAVAGYGEQTKPES